MEWEEGLLAWIDLEDEDQCAWAVSYLRKKGKRPHGSGGTSAQVVRRLSRDMETRADKELVRQMKSAWGSYRYAHTAGRGSRSFTLPSSVWSKLSQLAKNNGTSASQTLQDIIEAASRYEKFESKKLREAKRRAADPAFLTAKRRVRQHTESKELAELRRFRDAILQLANNSTKDGSDPESFLEGSRVPSPDELDASKMSEEKIAPAELQEGANATAGGGSQALPPAPVISRDGLPDANGRGSKDEALSGSRSAQSVSESGQKAGHEGGCGSPKRNTVYGSLRHKM